MCLKEQMTDLPWYYLYSDGCKGCNLGTALSGIVTVPWHVNDTNEMLVVYTYIETFLMTSDVSIERIDYFTIPLS